MKKGKYIFIIILSSIMCGGSFAGEIRTGTTFSQVQCEYFDMPWKQTFEKILDMKFDIIRLGAYWNEIEKRDGEYDFSALDWQISKALERNVDVILTVGMKVPRWPEFYLPQWVEDRISVRKGSDISADPFLRQRVLRFITETVRRYRKKTVIKYWQVENEAVNKIGPGSWYIGPEFLKSEAALVRMMDPDRKIVMTKATYPNRFLRILTRIFMPENTLENMIDLCDIVGLNVYPNVGNKVLGKDIVFRSSEKEMRRYFRELIGRIREKGKTVWVVELQAEPWDPGHLVYIKEALPKTASVGETEKTFFEFEKMGVENIFFWGVEYWLYRLEKYKDNEWIEMFNNIKKGDR